MHGPHALHTRTVRLLSSASVSALVISDSSLTQCHMLNAQEKGVYLHRYRFHRVPYREIKCLINYVSVEQRWKCLSEVCVVFAQKFHAHYGHVISLMQTDCFDLLL